MTGRYAMLAIEHGEVALDGVTVALICEPWRTPFESGGQTRDVYRAWAIDKSERPYEVWWEHPFDKGNPSRIKLSS